MSRSKFLSGKLIEPKKIGAGLSVTDLVDGILRLMDAPTNEPVNIGNPAELTIQGMAETIVRMTGSTSRIVSTASNSARLSSCRSLL